MRLQPATPLHDYEEERVSGFGDRESRRERKAARRDRKQESKSDRRERKVDRKKQRIVRKRQKIQQRLVPVMVPAQASSAPTLQPAKAAPSPQRRAPGQLLERAVDWVDEFVDEGGEEPSEDFEEDATEGFGAESWGPSVPMGRRLRIQAALGHRAAVIELKPGLYLVAEVPDAVTRAEFGLAPLLAPMMMRAARRSMDEPGEQRRGPFARMFRRRQPAEPVRYVQVVAAPAAPTAPTQAPLALPTPTEDSMFVPAPNVGWADDATVAAAYGCDACERRGRR